MTDSRATPQRLTAEDVKRRLRSTIKLFHNADQHWGSEMAREWWPEAPEHYTLMDWLDDGIETLAAQGALSATAASESAPAVAGPIKTYGCEVCKATCITEDDLQAAQGTSEDAKDAARYRWLRDQDSTPHVIFGKVNLDNATADLLTAKFGDEFDAAIDAAMNTKTPRVAHSKSEYKRITAQGGDVLPPTPNRKEG